MEENEKNLSTNLIKIMAKSQLSILYLLADRGHDLSLHQGYTVHVQKILSNLTKMKHRPFLLTINERKKLPNFESYLTIPHRYVRGIHKILPYTGLFNSLRIYLEILRLNNNYRFDVIHERYGLHSLGGVMAAKALNKNCGYFLLSIVR